MAASRERLLDYYGMLDERGRPYGFPPMPVVEDLKPEDDQRATSNLFIGNLDGSVTEAELRRGFDKYGIIEDVVIKRPARGQGGAYAFVKFQNLDMAHRAKVAISATFDRFGSIRNIDYVKGDSFAYIQYESLDAAQAACTQMRGFPLGGPERRLRVDFAKVEESPSRPFPPGYQPPVPLPSHYDVLGEAYSRHRSLEREMRGARDRSSPPSHNPLSQRERERALLERDFPSSPTRSLDRRVGAVEAFGRRGARSRSRSRERWLKEREERRSRRRSRSRSLSADRPAEDRDRERDKERGRSRVRGQGGALSPDASPDRARVRAPDSTTEPRDHSPIAAAAGVTPPNSDAVNAASPAIHTDTHSSSSSPSSLSEFAQATLSKMWHGFFALKNSSFPTDLFLLEGGSAFFNSVMKDSLKQQSQNQPSQLKIAQRLRMDQTRLDEVSRRIKLGRPDGFSILLALQGPVDRQAPAPEPGLQVRLLRHLVTYLRTRRRPAW
uniref:RNA binding motif protein 15B n=1 Tax=Sphaeramia orbicularis TaxID=375764 RepID=A0A673AXY6_9TELE